MKTICYGCGGGADQQTVGHKYMLKYFLIKEKEEIDINNRITEAQRMEKDKGNMNQKQARVEISVSGKDFTVKMSC